MSTVKTNAILDVSGGNTATINSMTPTADSLQGFRNRIINGDMRIDQRNAGASGTATYTYTVDRWCHYFPVASKFSWQQNAGSVTPPAGFTNYMGFTVTTGYTPTSTDVFSFFQCIEGYNIADWNWGSANAKTITLSFWVRSSLTGTFGGQFLNSASNKGYGFSYTINAANTWEQKTITVPGPTSGTWNSTNGNGTFLYFGLGVGSAYQAASGSWNNNDGQYAPPGAVNVVATTGATWYITGVQLEVGSVATPFERRDYGRELMMCERYFQIVEGGYSGSSVSGQPNAGKIYFRTVMRASATVTWTSTLRNFGGGWTVGAPAGFYMTTDQTKYAHPYKSASSTVQDSEFWDRYNLSAEL